MIGSRSPVPRKRGLALRVFEVPVPFSWGRVFEGPVPFSWGHGPARSFSEEPNRPARLSPRSHRADRHRSPLRRLHHSPGRPGGAVPPPGREADPGVAGLRGHPPASHRGQRETRSRASPHARASRTHQRNPPVRSGHLARPSQEGRPRAFHLIRVFHLSCSFCGSYLPRRNFHNPHDPRKSPVPPHPRIRVDKIGGGIIIGCIGNPGKIARIDKLYRSEKPQALLDCGNGLISGISVGARDLRGQIREDGLANGAG